MGSGVSVLWVSNLDIFNIFSNHFVGSDFSVYHPIYHWSHALTFSLELSSKIQGALQILIATCLHFILYWGYWTYAMPRYSPRTSQFFFRVPETHIINKERFHCMVCKKLCCNEQWLLKHSQLSYSLIETTSSSHILTYFEARYNFLHLSSWDANH